MVGQWQRGLEPSTFLVVSGLIHSPNYSFFWEIDVLKCKLLEDRDCVLTWVVKYPTQSSGKYQPGRQEPWNLGFTVILALANYLVKWGHWFIWNQKSFELMVVHWRNIHQWMWTAKHHSQAFPSWRQLPLRFSSPLPSHPALVWQNPPSSETATGPIFMASSQGYVT